MLYNTAHISTVYSQKANCGINGSCEYEIIHAYGVECTEIDEVTGNCLPGAFTRKVIVTPNTVSATINDPNGFGRIKLWN